MDDNIDFKKESLIFLSSVGAKTWYNLSLASVKKILIVNNELN